MNRQATTPCQSCNARPASSRYVRTSWPSLAFVCLLLVVCFGANAAPLTTRVDREVVPVGETVTLSLIFEGVTPPSAPNLPAFPNLKLVSSSQRSEYTLNNGQMTGRQTYDYGLVPTREGEIIIPGMQMQIGGQVLTTQPIKLRVTSANAPAQSPEQAATNLAFLRLVVPKSEIYVGEGFPVEIQLYWQNAQDIQIPQLKAEGFSLSAASKPTQSQTQVGGVGYNIAIFRMSAVAAKPGTLALGPAECNLTILIPIQSNNRRRSPFDDPFGFFGGPRVQGRPTLLRSETVPIRVLPLPTQNVPANFSGAVGSYTLNLNAGPTNVAVGDPVTLRVAISGQGPLESLALPEQSQWRDFRFYPPNSKVELADTLGLSGTKTFEQVVIPQNHEITSIPPFQFSFFDPQKKSYQMLSTAPIPMLVRPSLANAPPPMITNNAGARQDTPQPSDDIVHIRPRLDTIALVQPPLVRQGWFLALQIVPAGVWLALLILRKRREALANNPRLRRSREVAQRVREGLKNLETFAPEQKSDEFFALLFRLLQEQLGATLDLPAGAITEAVIDEKLPRGSLPPETLQELHALFQACNQARYAPLKTSGELASLIPRAQHVLQAIQQSPPSR